MISADVGGALNARKHPNGSARTSTSLGRKRLMDQDADFFREGLAPHARGLFAQKLNATVKTCKTLRLTDYTSHQPWEPETHLVFA